VPVLYGSSALLPGPSGQSNDWKIFNAVTRYDPGAANESGRQFKRRLFPGGETMPGANLPWLGWLMDWLGGGRSSSRAVWLTPGTNSHAFTVTNAAQVWRHRVVICSEALFPEDTGSFLASATGKPTDFVTVPGNLGGFARNRAQRWYFASLRVRAVEARIGLACSLNTGISGFVRPDGSVHGLVTNAGLAWTGRGAPELKPMAELLDLRLRREAELATNGVLRAEVQRQIEEIKRLRAEAGVSGYSVDRVWTHPGITPYSRTGDLLGGSLCLAMGLAALAELGLSFRFHFRLFSPHRSA
jgi:apolipoprotein N-acyltransferase